MSQLPNYSLCGPLGAPLSFQAAPGRTPAQKIVALLADAYRRLAFFRKIGAELPDEEWTNASKLCAIAVKLFECADRRELADLRLARASVVDQLAR